MTFLPKKFENIVKTPPIKIQGIKSKLVPFISESISWEGGGTFIEPFMGSGVVAFNLCPEKAILSDTNIHIINFYKEIQSGNILPETIRDFLEIEGEFLRKEGKDYYYEVRKRFNEFRNSLDFLFLNRSCFNGLMRFNSKGEFNVPFCHKPDRFRKAYITKISNQVGWVREIIEDKNWQFICQDWEKTVELGSSEDFIYCDPPYFGRNADYFNQWEELDSDDLARKLSLCESNWALSTWIKNKYRNNDKLKQWFPDNKILSYEHFYHLGSSESLRTKMEEGLVLKNKKK